MTDKWDKAYTGFAGIDYIIIQNGKEFGRAQAFAYNITRQVEPVCKDGKLIPGIKTISGVILFKDYLLNVEEPFDIIMIAANEKGDRMVKYIKDVELTSQGKPISEIKIDTQYTFVAKNIKEWEPIDD